MKNQDKISTDIGITYSVSNIPLTKTYLEGSSRTVESSSVLPQNKLKFFPLFCFFSIFFIYFFLSACTDLGTNSSTAQYTVSFETNGGSSVPPVTVTGGTALSQTITATKAADGDTTYYFGDWYTTATGHTGKTKYDYTKRVTGNMTLYARWYTEQPADRVALMTTIAALSDNEDLNHIDVRKVTNMGQLFQGKSTFNGDISGWDVSKVTIILGMFEKAETFNQPIGDWDVSNVTTMYNMFREAKKFNQAIGDWDVSNVTSMEGMFREAKEFNQTIENWNVSKVTIMLSMFQEAEKFNQLIGGWNVSKVTTMKSMFYKASAFNQPIGRYWDVSGVTDMERMFQEAEKFNQDLEEWDVSSVTNMSNMFNGTTAFDQNISTWTVTQVTDYADIFTDSGIGRIYKPAKFRLP
ncbi:BspA family leucine-rich repeat surface protein [Candidatus Haliotispira prima]|uniref:BspA family leucine-rich repeat surface protein n=1 Tax=Candidatus Haliotispira prima TaxID=3034016 RepID=A0ABY8MJI7_9SPIO|nr:BspA family leucine-rich repeat surface protein [Candidatus Haliotispira prima]